jgi:hypothetical protein
MRMKDKIGIDIEKKMGLKYNLIKLNIVRKAMFLQKKSKYTIFINNIIFSIPILIYPNRVKIKEIR